MTTDLHSKSRMCFVLETDLMRKFAADLSLQIINNHSGKVWLEILVANLATNFQDLVAKVKNLVALAPVLGAILRPAPVPLWASGLASGLAINNLGGEPVWVDLDCWTAMNVQVTSTRQTKINTWFY